MENRPSASYPRWLIRTSRASAVLLAVEFLVFASLVAMRASVSPRPIYAFAPHALLAVMTAATGARLIGLLRQLEEERQSSDDVLLRLFDLTLMVPVVGFAGVLIALRWA